MIVKHQRPSGLSSTCWLAQIQSITLSTRILIVNSHGIQ